MVGIVALAVALETASIVATRTTISMKHTVAEFAGTTVMETWLPK